MINEKLKELVSDIFEIKTSDIVDELRFEDIPEWESLKFLALITEIEEEWSIKFTMNEIETMDSLDKMSAAVLRHVES